MNEDIVERIVLESYKERLLKYTSVPSSVAVLRNCDDVIYRNAYDTIYPNITDNKIDVEIVHAILGKYKCIHSYDGTTYFNAQNVIFPNWFISVVLADGTYLLIDEEAKRNENQV
jgi:hypothetical protein